MKSSDKIQGKKILIKRDQVSPLITKKSNQIISGQKTIHVRRHSIMGSKINQRGQFVVSHSHQSSKQIKSLSKHKKIKLEQYLYQNEKTQKFCTNLLRETDSLGLRKDFMQKNNYKYINMIGKGGFGKVWKVKHTSTGQIFALKQMSKATVIAKRSVESILNQRSLLSTLKHRYLVNMVYAFQDRTSLYLVMNLMEGGDLRYHIAKRHIFSELQTRFLVATIILSLQYLHKKMIIHRDVKPQNIVFDDKGYAHLTDLGIAKYIRAQNFQDTSGTPGYMAPEVMFHHNHRFQVDFFALGVIIYQLMIGKRPYLGKNRQQIKQLILLKQAIIKKRQIPENWSIQSADFANKLLQRKPIRRLGWGGINQLKQHRWLKGFPWKQLANQQLQSPFKQKYNPLQVRYRVTQLETQYKKLLNKNKQMLQKGNLQQYFNGYTYQGISEANQMSKSTYLFK